MPEERHMTVFDESRVCDMFGCILPAGAEVVGEGEDAYTCIPVCVAHNLMFDLLYENLSADVVMGFMTAISTREGILHTMENLFGFDPTTVEDFLVPMGDTSLALTQSNPFRVSNA